MGTMDSLRKEFKNSTSKPLVIKDSRFGIRRLFVNSQERPRIATYSEPGRGQNGEHQN
jgi:hypothetical protein